ncbi:SLAC1 anion channel family protein [Thiohalocapsa sp.]|jgi:tellurite resistance protein|uniref:SLAC1 anion channel family protein n=1 Tax=Thiohalocapsa sp. TaxID=2497641 RepID=UPI0025CD0355|nr:SLAC1 anion channel family protein [Thiohalocapsa sp.]
MPDSRLEHFPAAFFAMVMGLAGLTIGWEKAQAVLGRDFPFVPWLIGAATLLFAGLALLYIAKLVLHPAAVRAEVRHPVRINFMPTMAISLLLLAIVYLHAVPEASRWLWLTGAALQLGFTLFVVNAWMHHEHFQVQHMNPAWFIPAVGNVLVPVAGVPLGYELVSWFFFSVGILLWPVLLTIVFYRVLFHQPLPERLMPTLFILVAPPAVGFIAYVRLTGEVDVFAQILYFSALFFTVLLATQVTRFLRIRFYLSWWAYSFPLAAISIASILMAEQTGLVGFLYLGFGLLTMLSGIVVLLLIQTARAVRERGICLPE